MCANVKNSTKLSVREWRGFSGGCGNEVGTAAEPQQKQQQHSKHVLSLRSKAMDPSNNE